jgi:DNA-binding response OmpR family regulator
MDMQRRDQIQRSLFTLVQSQVATLEFLEKTFELLREEFSLDPVTYFQRHTGPPHVSGGEQQFCIDPTLFSVTFRGKACFLGNTLPFRVLVRLAQRPNTYVSYEDLLSEVWNGIRSDAAVRSVVKTLRLKLRAAGMSDLAAAIDGAASGHYSLKLTC